jgi:hypothetical protein
MKRSDARSGNGGRIRAEARVNARSLKALCLVAVLFVASGTPPRVRAESNGTSEYDIKAAFLFHFAQFVEWPQEAFENADSPLTYCTLGEDAFRGALDESVKGKHIGNRALRVLHLGARESIDGCQVLFIAASQRVRQNEELSRASRHPVLTVGELEHFAEEGGIIGFFLEEKKVRFEINVGAAENARLKISAKLLALAKTVLGSSRED